MAKLSVVSEHLRGIHKRSNAYKQSHVTKQHIHRALKSINQSQIFCLVAITLKIWKSNNSHRQNDVSVINRTVWTVWGDSALALSLVLDCANVLSELCREIINLDNKSELSRLVVYIDKCLNVYDVMAYTFERKIQMKIVTDQKNPLFQMYNI